MENNTSIRLRDQKINFHNQPSNQHSKIAPVLVLGATALCTSMAHAVTPTYQAVANYFTGPGMCITGGEGALGVRQAGNVFAPQALPGGPWNCDNLSGGEGGAFQTGVENLLNGGTFQQTQNGLRAIANEEVITMGTLNVEISGAQMHNLTAHVQGLHQGGLGMRQPSIPAITISSSTRSGGSRRTISKACSPLDVVVTERELS